MEQPPITPAWNKAKVQELEIELIIPDPGNPRRPSPMVDAGLQELADNISTFGLIQPILVRPITGHKKAKWMIVIGHRRFTASQLASLGKIRAFVVDMTPEQAHEMQIIENLHRSDIHPLQEAEAMKELHERMNILAIARLIGKGVHYVAGRMRLNNLIDGWKHFFEEDHISLKQAGQIARMHAGLQGNLWTQCQNKLRTVTPGEYIDLWQLPGLLRDSELDLELATFDTQDEHLIAEAGPCTSCQYNSQNSELFKMEFGHVCRNPACFQDKTSKAFHMVAREAHESGYHLLSTVSWLDGPDTEKKKQLGEWGYPLLMRHDFKIIEEPEHPGDLEHYAANFERDWPTEPGYFDEDWNDQMNGEPHEWTELEIQEAEAGIVQSHERALDQYEQAKQRWEEEKDQPLLDAVIVICEVPADYGRKVKILVKNPAALNGQGELAMNTPDQQIIKMELRAQRSVELDAEKQWKEFRRIVRGDGHGKDRIEPLYRPTIKEGALTVTELVAACNTMYHKGQMIGYQNDIRDYLKIKDKTNWEFEKQFVERMKESTADQLQELLLFLTRIYILTEGMPYSQESTKDPLLPTSIEFIREKQPLVVAEIELKYDADQQRREARLRKRIKEVKEGGGQEVPAEAEADQQNE